jgi:hypothetical protein
MQAGSSELTLLASHGDLICHGMVHLPLFQLRRLYRRLLGELPLHLCPLVDWTLDIQSFTSWGRRDLVMAMIIQYNRDRELPP